MKQCTKCNQTKPLSEFYKQKGRPQAKCKECVKQIRKEYYSQNSDTVKERTRKYRNSNLDVVRQRENNYHKQHPEVNRKAKRKYYTANKEQILNRQRKHREDNPELYRSYCRKRRALRKSIKEVYTTEDEMYTKKMFNHRCANCGSTSNLEIDHHYPLSEGHPLTRSNAVLLCRSCNASKNSKLPEDFYNVNKLLEINNLLCKT